MSIADSIVWWKYSLALGNNRSLVHIFPVVLIFIHERHILFLLIVGHHYLTPLTNTVSKIGFYKNTIINRQS